ncbi:hypothetical protein CDAR_128581 [Caerostris darwini]|uniref:Uncharacterized protein n=1 Tax=Caerostris darwini TaxID=1538125 RepID=A0AAV4VI62_9ARAC|nr:hypothetical protein CDAR_128581 [Caerostris darwini]
MQQKKNPYNHPSSQHQHDYDVPVPRQFPNTTDESRTVSFPCINLQSSGYRGSLFQINCWLLNGSRKRELSVKLTGQANFPPFFSSLLIDIRCRHGLD